MSYRLDGFSTPFGGISWSKLVDEKDRIKYLFTFLSSKRILTNPIEMEIKEQCIDSVLDIKQTLVEITKDVKFSKSNITEIYKMISSCNKYLDKINSLNLPHIIYKDNDNLKWEDYGFDTAMKNFRDEFNESISIIERNTGIKSNIIISKIW